MSQVHIHQVSHTYVSPNRRTEALSGVSLEIGSGEPIALIGPSGCGKSSLLKMIAGLRTPAEGTIEVAGAPVDRPRRQTALILQDYGLLPWKTVVDNAALGLTIGGTKRAEARDRAREALAVVGLADFEKAYPAQLSGGMAQRLAIARAITVNVDLMLMDEPLSALDSLTREDLQGVLLDLWRVRGYAQVLVTHSIEEAVFLGRRIVLMTPRPGRIHRIVDNPGMGERSYRQTPEFYSVCAELRELLLEEGALAR